METQTEPNALIQAILDKKDLNAEQAETLANAFLEKALNEAQMKAALVGLNEKTIHVDEIVGFAQSMRRHALSIHPNVPLVDTCGTGGDGAHTFNISTAAAFVVAACGQAVAKHGNQSVSGKCGSADVLREVGFDVNLPFQKTKRMIERENFGFLFAPLYHLAMKNVAPVRKALGVKTIFNFLGPLTNPAGIKRQVIGVFGKENQQKMAEAAKALGTERTLVVCGAHTD
ncbi:MAG: anthranilate phosphoribosyltransferase, partial [Candidatus Micrarchaeota archaeon]|nr:anthranilate phosphoribosyltransferase [Candidatus Micrarchaeota archaeon]